MHRRLALLTSATAGLAFAAAAPAPAATTTFGSSLQAPASVVETHPVDTAFWPTAVVGGASTAPVDGQILSVRVKGKANSDPQPGTPGGETLWHLQALHLQGDGTFQVLRTSQGFELPHTGDAQQVSTYAPTNFCIAKGDYLAFNTVGGFGGRYPMGTPLQIFAPATGSTTAQFTSPDKTNNGDTLTPTPVQGQELLMQATVGSGTDAAGFCPGGGAAGGGGGGGGKPGTAPKVQKVTLPAKQRVTITKKGSVSISLFCLPGSKPCSGKASVLSRGARKRKSYGAKSFKLTPKSSGKVKFRLNKTGRKAFASSHKKLKVRIQVVTMPGGPTRTSTLDLTLRKRGAK